MRNTHVRQGRHTDGGVLKKPLRVTLIALAILIVASVAIVGFSQTRVPPYAPVGFPADGQTATLLAEVDVPNVNDGRGIIQVNVPVKIDGYMAWENFPTLVTENTWVRSSRWPVYIPARLLPTKDSEVLRYATYLTGGAALRLVVKRQGDRLYITKAEPLTVSRARAAAAKVERLGGIDLSDDVVLDGIVNGSGYGEDGPGKMTVDFNTPSTIKGFPVWLLVKADVPSTVRAFLDSKPVDLSSGSELGFGPYEVLGSILENQTRATFHVGGDRLEVIRVEGTSQTHRGPYPGDSGSLEEEGF